MNDAGNWMSNKEALKNLVVDYYPCIFSKEEDVGDVHYLRSCFPMLEDDQQQELAREYEPDEIWRALRKLGPSKLLGPDGFPALFFQKTWESTGPH